MLRQSKAEIGPISHCERCDGCAVNVAVLRRSVPEAALRKLWSLARCSCPRSRRCPSCPRLLASVQLHGVTLDLCSLCQLVWFDAGEIPQLRGALPVPSSPSPDEKSRFEAAGNALRIDAELRMEREDRQLQRSRRFDLVDVLALLLRSWN